MWKTSIEVSGADHAAERQDLLVDRGDVAAHRRQGAAAGGEDHVGLEPLDAGDAVGQRRVDALPQLAVVVGEARRVAPLDAGVRRHLEARGQRHAGADRRLAELLELLEVAIAAPPPLVVVEAEERRPRLLHVAAQELAGGGEHVHERHLTRRRRLEGRGTCGRCRGTPPRATARRRGDSPTRWRSTPAAWPPRRPCVSTMALEAVPGQRRRARRARR